MDYRGRRIEARGLKINKPTLHDGMGNSVDKILCEVAKNMVHRAVHTYAIKMSPHSLPKDFNREYSAIAKKCEEFAEGVYDTVCTLVPVVIFITYLSSLLPIPNIPLMFALNNPCSPIAMRVHIIHGCS